MVIHSSEADGIMVKSIDLQVQHTWRWICCENLGTLTSLSPNVLIYKVASMPASYGYYEE